MSKCIFYLPYKLDKSGKGARMLRPRKMIQAFEAIGYDVFVIEGWSAERRKKIAQVKKDILNGVKYDFVYSESSTEPTLLTDPSHLPTHPFLDFGFFKFARKHGIKIGLFYCDIYWKFSTYGEGLPAWKKKAALMNYRYDVKQYKKTLDVIYVPDMKMCNYLNEPSLKAIAKELPPGADDIVIEKRDPGKRDFSKNPLTIFYVGGIGSHYRINELMKAVHEADDTKLILCCRETEWEKEKAVYEPYLDNKIEVVHKSSHELEPYYRDADICSLLFMSDEYRGMAKPFKAYEYLAHEVPVISTKGTAIGEFVEKNAIGWNIDFDAAEIRNVLDAVRKDPSVLDTIRENCSRVKRENLWTCRAETVAADLK